MTSTDYTNKKIDISTFPRKDSGKAQMGFGGGTSLVIAGPLKASQNFARVFLSESQKRKERSNFGTRFGSDISGSTLWYPIQIVQYFYINANDATEYLKEGYPADTPADERIKRVSLKNYSVSGTNIFFDVEIFLESGQNTTFLLPVSF